MILVKWLVGLLLVLAFLLGALFAGARFHDGPLAIVPGGPLVGGPLVTAPVSDWGFAGPALEIEQQLLVDDVSRTTWIVVHEGNAYIPCNLGFPPFKRWHKRAVMDGRALVRIDGKRYPVTLVRASDEALVAALAEVAAAKYPSSPPSGKGLWFFRLEPRPAA